MENVHLSYGWICTLDEFGRKGDTQLETQQVSELRLYQKKKPGRQIHDDFMVLF